MIGHKIAPFRIRRQKQQYQSKEIPSNITGDGLPFLFFLFSIIQDFSLRNKMQIF